jgi:GNAT superfamily N-acetyltransferase
VATEADAAAFRDVCTAAFAAPPELADLIMPSLAFALDPAMLWLLGFRNGEPVAAGGYYRTGDVAVVCCLATQADHRGRGIGAAVTRACLADAAGRGCTAAALRSGPNSVPLYERLGFRYACQHRTYAAPAA